MGKRKRLPDLTVTPATTCFRCGETAPNPEQKERFACARCDAVLKYELVTEILADERKDMRAALVRVSERLHSLADDVKRMADRCDPIRDARLPRDVVDVQHAVEWGVANLDLSDLSRRLIDLAVSESSERVHRAAVAGYLFPQPAVADRFGELRPALALCC
jgi:ribosomal protein S27AE